MAVHSQPITQLPALYNPLLNCLFNNPNYNRAPFKRTITELSLHHTDYAILVPSTVVLNEGYDPDTETSSRKVSLRHLCYTSEDFIQSHIIKTTSYSSSVTPISKSQSVIYTTMNNKQVLIKNGMVFTGKGYKRSLKLAILSNTYMNTFRDYFPKGSKVMLIYIEDSLFGSYSPSVSPIAPEIPTRPAPNATKFAPITFEKLLRNFPMLSTVVADKFYRLFHHNNDKYRLLHTSTRKPLKTIQNEFSKLVDEAFSIISNSVKPENPYGEQTHNLINHILNLYPQLNLNKVVHEYVELNLYDKLWNQLLIQFNCPNDDKSTYDENSIKTLTPENYEKLSCLSFNQLDIPPQTPWNANLLQSRIVKSIEELSKLEDSSVVNSAQKTDTLINAVNILTDTKGTDLVIDADTLIGLLIMVVIHAKISNFEAHLYYIKHFNSVDYANDGQFNYILSNFDAVVYHLSSTLNNVNDESDLVSLSFENFDFWSAIENNDHERVQETLSKVNQEYPDDEIPPNHFLKSKNVNGESSLMCAIKAKNHTIFRLLLDYNPNWFSIDEILFDMNISTKTTLLMASVIEGCTEISRDIVSLIVENCTPEEQLAYFNLGDTSGRTVGHYLFHDINLIDVVGQYIDWEIKDMNSHTPLISLCRCYDHPDYGGLLSKVFKCIYKKYGRGKVNFDNHIDKMKNTLLHVILKDLNKTELLSDNRNLINLNSMNCRNMTPLTISVKYNRLEILKELLKDNRLNFLHECPKNFYNVFDYIGYSSGKANNTNSTFQEIESRVFNHFVSNYFPVTNKEMLTALNARFDPGRKDWVVFLKSSKFGTNHIYLDKLKQLLYLTKLENPLSLFPDERTFWMNFKADKSSITIFPKYQVNRLLENLNSLFMLVNLQTTIDHEKLIQKFINASSVLSKDEKSTFELIQHVNKLHEIEREKLGSVDLTLPNIEEIEIFLSFSLKDLQTYEKMLIRLTKLIAIADIKQNDLQLVYDESIDKYFQMERSNVSEFHGSFLLHDTNLNVFHFHAMKLDLALSELIANITKVMGKTTTWKQIYQEIREFNSEIKTLEDQLAPKAANSTPNLTRRNTLSESTPIEIPEEGGTSSFFNFSSITKNKTARYKQLILAKSDKIKQIVDLNREIKLEHEIIAGEISNFLQFKPKFFSFAIKRYVSTSITCHHHRKFHLASLRGKVASA